MSLPEIPGATIAQRYIIGNFIAENDAPSTCGLDIFLATRDLLSEDEASNQRHLTDWWNNHTYLHNKNSGRPIDKPAERLAFGLDGTLKARAALRAHYGDETYAVRRDAWGCSDATLKPGNDPEGVSAKVLAKADAIVKRDDADKTNPFNPANKIADRAAEIGVYILKHGSKAAQEQCKRFSVDIAGRPVVYKRA